MLSLLLKIPVVVIGAILTVLEWSNDGKKESSTSRKWAKRSLVVLLTLLSAGSIIYDYSDTEAERATSTERFKQIIATTTHAAGSADQAAKLATDSAQTASLAANNAEEASESAQHSTKALQTVLAGVQDTFREIERTSDPLSRVVVTLELTLPMTNPAVRGYRTRLDEGLRAYSRLSVAERDTVRNIGYYGTSVEVGGVMVGNVEMSSSYSLFPQSTGDERIAWGSFSIYEIELDFFKTPIDPALYEVSHLSVVSTAKITRQIKPDLVIGQKLSTRSSPQWLLRTSIPPKDEFYRLRLSDWTTPRQTWRMNTGSVRFLRDLAGSQLMISIGPSNQESLRSEFKLAELDLRINDGTVNIPITAVRKHVTKEDAPFWEVRFPTDFNGMFSATD